MREMESKERMHLFYSTGKADRIPVFSCATMYAGRQMGLSSQEFYFDVPKAFHAQKTLYKREGFDDTPCYDLPHGEVLDFGGALKIYETPLVELPCMKKFPVTSLEEAWNYQLPPVEQRIFTKYRMEFLKYAMEAGESSCSVSAGSPFTMVGSLVDTGTLMRWLVKEPETVRHLLKIAVDYLCETADAFIERWGAEKCFATSNYPFESAQMISGKMFEKYAYPAMLEVQKEYRGHLGGL